MSDKAFRFTEQTTKQPVRFRCMNEPCKTSTGRRDWFIFVGDEPICPKCKGGWPMVDKLSLIHFLIPNPKGHINGNNDGMLVRYSMCCDVRRYDLATLNNGEAATGDVNCVNCLGCLINIKALRMALNIDQEKLIQV